MHANVERKRRNFRVEESCSNAALSVPLFSPFLLEIGIKERQSKVQERSSREGREKRQEDCANSEATGARGAQNQERVFPSWRGTEREREERREKEKEREGIHFRRIRVYKDASNKIGNPTINTSEMLILPAGVSRRLPAAALGIIRDSRFMCKAPTSHTVILVAMPEAFQSGILVINMQRSCSVVAAFDATQVRIKQLFVLLRAAIVMQATLLPEKQKFRLHGAKVSNIKFNYFTSCLFYVDVAKQLRGSYSHAVRTCLFLLTNNYLYLVQRVSFILLHLRSAHGLHLRTFLQNDIAGTSRARTDKDFISPRSFIKR